MPSSVDDFDHHEAATHYMAPKCRFSWLSPGDVFRFPGSKVKLVKTRTGYRHVAGSPVFRTGARVAVIKLEDEP